MKPGQPAKAKCCTLAAYVITLAGTVTAPVHAQDQRPVDPSGIHAAMDSALREEQLVGVVWALVTPGEITTNAAGLRNARRSEPMTAADRIQVGSVVKTLIATAVLRLVTEGKLTLDTPVASLLPDVAIHNPWNASHPLLVRHLLDHTSGLEDARLWQVFSLRALPDTPLRESLGDPPVLRVRGRPGARLSYSNQGYTLLGMVIEGIAGERYETYLDAHLLRPLGMYHSTFQFVSQTGQHADERLAMGHFENGVTQTVVPIYLRPAGQFTTTAADMAILARFLMSSGEIDGAVFIDRNLLGAMGAPSTTEAAAAGLDAGYGLGLSRRDRHGVIGRCHVGTTIGYRANLCLFPREQKAFFIAMNADVEAADYTRFDTLLIHALALAPAEPAMPADPPAGVAGWEGIYEPGSNRIERFAYLDLVFNFATVRWDENAAQLHLKPFQGAASLLTQVGGMHFSAHDKSAASHVLLTSPEGRRGISDGFRTYEQVSRWRMVALWVSLAAGLSGLAYLLLAGLIRAVRRRLSPSEPVFAPFISVAVLAIPAPFFLSQSFLRLGELTPASVLLALVTGALPLAMAFGLWRIFKRGNASVRVRLEGLAMVAVLQWTVVLAVWGLLPMRLWS